jgi:hypothetical protein
MWACRGMCLEQVLLIEPCRPSRDRGAERHHANRYGRGQGWRRQMITGAAGGWWRRLPSRLAGSAFPPVFSDPTKKPRRFGTLGLWLVGYLVCLDAGRGFEPLTFRL